MTQKKLFEYGVQGGVNLNNVYSGGESARAGNSLTGFSVGANAKWSKTDHFGIRLQLSYEQFGWAYRGLVYESGLFTGAKSDLFNKLNYINLPVLAEYTLGRKVKWNIHAGIFTGYLIGSKSVSKNYPPLAAGQSAREEYDLPDMRRFNFGLSAGTGVQIPLSSKIAVAVDARNYTGLTSISKPNSGYSSFKTMTFSFLGGLTFRL